MVDGGGKTTNDESGPANNVGTTYMVSACGINTGATQHHGDSTDGMPHGAQAQKHCKRGFTSRRFR